MLQQSFERTIRQLCEDVLSVSEPSDLPQRIIEHVQETFPVEWSTLWVTEQKSVAGDKRLRLAAAAAGAKKLLTAENGSPAVYDFGEGLTGDIAMQRRTVNITKPEDFENYQHISKYDQVMYARPHAGDLCRCVLGVPLLLKSQPDANAPDSDPWRVIGVLKLENVRETPEHSGRFFSNEDAEIVEGYAAVIAVALEKAQMRADSIRIGAGLLKVSQKLLGELGGRPDLDEIVKQTANVISAEACALWLRSGLQLRLEASHGYPGCVKNIPPYSLEDPNSTTMTAESRPDDSGSLEKSLKGKGLTVYVARTTHALNLKTAKQVREHFAWKGELDNIVWDKEQGNACYSLVAIPLVDDETKDLKGVFKIENKKPTIFQLQNFFTDEDQQLLSTLGNSISLSLITAERVDRLRRLEKLVGDIRVLETLDEALFSILKGLTHGGGLQYNRAMIFLQAGEPEEPQQRRLTCLFAIGEVLPGDWQAARESENDHQFLDLDVLLRRYRKNPQVFQNNPMMKAWRRREIVLTDTDNQIIARHVNNPKRDTGKYNSGDLSEADVLSGFVKNDFVLIPMYIDKKLLGIIYADNQFTGNLINQFECEVLDLFAGMAGAIIQASQVPERLRNERDQAWRSFSRPAAHRLGTEAGIIENEASLGIEQELEDAVPVASGKLPMERSVVENSLKVIKQAVNRLRLAVKDYRKLSFEPDDPIVFDFCQLVRETKANTTDNLKQINVEFRSRPSKIMVTARREGLAYVLEELLINAWKEAEENSAIDAYIEVTCEDDVLQCIVCDNGPGVPDGLREGLFRKPQRGRRGGTGLGLCIVDRVLKENLGSIELAESSRITGYKGACFILKIPVDITNGLKKVTTYQPITLAEDLSSQLENDTILQDIRILVVEDSPDLRRHLAILLEPHGIKCILKQNEHEAIDAISSVPDMIIADIDLSEAGGDIRGGIKLAEKMQQLGYHIPFILVSYDPWNHLPRSGSFEFRRLMDKLCVFAVLDRNEATFREELVASIRDGIKNIHEEIV